MQAENIPCQSNWNSVTFSCYLKPHHVPTYSFLFDTVLDNAELLSIRMSEINPKLYVLLFFGIGSYGVVGPLEI